MHDQLSAQQLLDRVLARVDTNPITLTDVQAALALGIVQIDSGDPVAEGTQRMIDRQLELTEVQRFPPPEPAPDAVMREAARLKMNVGTRLPALMRSTGLTEQRIADIARDNLRIAGYLDQRFGTIVQVSDDEVAAYYRTHEAEFTKGGVVAPYEEAIEVSRQRVSSERRRTTISQWIRDLRSRADIIVNPPISSGQSAVGSGQWAVGSGQWREAVESFDSADRGLPTADYIINTVDPVVFRDSRSLCACTASLTG